MNLHHTERTVVVTGRNERHCLWNSFLLLMFPGCTCCQYTKFVLSFKSCFLDMCSENTKTALVDSMYVFLKQPEFSKYISELGSVSPRILLTGPPGMCAFAGDDANRDCLHCLHL